MTILNLNLFRAMRASNGGQDDQILKQTIEARPKVKPYILEHLKQNDQYWLETEEGLLMFKNRIYIPCDNKLREEIISAHHDTPLAEHLGQALTAKLIMRNYW
jgi:hypothetical protein